MLAMDVKTQKIEPDRIFILFMTDESFGGSV